MQKYENDEKYYKIMKWYSFGVSILFIILFYVALLKYLPYSALFCVFGFLFSNIESELADLRLEIISLKKKTEKWKSKCIPQNERLKKEKQ